MTWSEKQLIERGYRHEWTFNETFELIENPQRIPYLGFFKTDQSFPNESPELVLSLAPKDEDTELSVRNYSALLKMMERKLHNIKPEVDVDFINLGTSGLRWHCGGETPFLIISTKFHKQGLSEQINFVLEDFRTYRAIWSDPISQLEREMEKYRGPNVYSSR